MTAVHVVAVGPVETTDTDQRLREASAQALVNKGIDVMAGVTVCMVGSPCRTGIADPSMLGNDQHPRCEKAPSKSLNLS